MKYLVAFCLLFVCSLQSFGQQSYFTYIQTDNNQAFYLRLAGTVYSSAAAGYLILSRMPDSACTVTIGFPKNAFPEQLFNLPANHKDGGYTLRNFSDKGWGLVNLQTQMVIMTLTPPEEKKKSELTGIRKTDAFSLLLSNAVNDTAVLYAAIKPPKPVVPAAAAEKKPDSADLVTTIAPDSNKVRVTIPRTINKTDTLTAKQKGVRGESVAISKNAKPGKTGAPVRNAPKKTSVLTAKNNRVNRKDTIIMGDGRETVAKGKSTAKNNKENTERKDTIIMMDGKNNDRDNVASRTEKTPEQPSAKDSLVIKKQILQAPEEKRDALLNNRDAVQVEKVPVKKDSVANAGGRQDSTASIAANEAGKLIGEKKDSMFDQPVRRIRPLINKAAELFTDTSYIAVFVDESKDKFDTVRISIPFNETSAFSSLFNRSQPTPDSQKIKKDTTVSKVPVETAVDTFKSVNSAVPASANSTDSNKNNTVPTVRNNDTASDKKHPDSSRPLPTRTDSAVKAKDSSRTAGLSTDSIQKRVTKDSVAIDKKDTPVAAQKPALLLVNSDCREVAVDSDIDKLRIKMLLMTNDEDRIGLAKKLFRQKCMLVKHVRALSELFTSDEGKYKWFDASYPYVSDSGNFASLAELIKDDYYLNRFKAMLRH